MIVVVTGSDSSSGRVSERRLVKMEMTACFWSDGCGNFVRFSNAWSVSIFFWEVMVGWRTGGVLLLWIRIKGLFVRNFF